MGTLIPYLAEDKLKLDNIESEATKNQTDAYLLGRANHTGTQAAATISDFDTEVTNNSSVAANTAKVSADGSVTTHSDVTSAGSGAIITTAERSEITANTAKVTNATHTGEVTGSGVLTVDPTAISNKPLVSGASGQEVLINDAGTLKKVDANDFIGGASVFGDEWQSAENGTARSTSSTSFQQAQRLTTPSLPAGTYRIAFVTLHRLTSSSYDPIVRVQVNDSTTLFDGENFRKEARDSGSDQRENYSGFDYYTGSGVINIDVDYRSSNTGATAYMYYTRIEIWRVS